VTATDLTVALRAARAGASVVRTALQSPGRAQTTFKGEANPVTEIDHRSEEAILALLDRERPDDHILSEESGGAEWSSGRVWIVDPLDGTVNFIHRIPHVAVSVALWVDGVPRAAVIEDVVREEEFAASRGEGTTINGRVVWVSAEDRIGQAMIATGFPYDRNLHASEYAANLGEVLARVQGIRRFGSAALDLAWVAAGRFDGYWEFGLGPWDGAAGVLLVTEAGGTATNHRGDVYSPTAPGVVATNGKVHADLLAAVRARLPSHIT
jgi:myo-inositol-1(or 4)-monophosphatase